MRELESADAVLWRAGYMRRAADAARSSKENTRSGEEINIDVLEDEMSVIVGELSTSDDPGAQKRMKEMIDERKSIIAEQEIKAD